MTEENRTYITHLKVTDVPWHRLTTAYGRGTDFPAHLTVLEQMRDLASVKKSLYRQNAGRIEAELSAIYAKKDRLLEMSIEGALSTAEFKQRNDAFNQQIHELEGQMEVLKTEEEKSQISVEQLGKIKAALEAELSFQNGVNSALVATILDHIVVKKGSTKEEVFLDIYLKFGDPYGVVFDRENSSFCFTRPRNITAPLKTRTILSPLVRSV